MIARLPKVAVLSAEAMSEGKVLVVDDDRSVVLVLRGNLEEEGYEVLTAATAEDGLALMDNHHVDAVVTDLKMPGKGGAWLVAEVRRRFEDVPVLVLTAFPSIESAVEVMRTGAFDYLQKPFGRGDLLHSLGKAIVASRAGGARIAPESDPGLVVRSAAMAKLDALVRRVARTDATVLLTGETGVGKEVVARTIHELSPRASAAFLKVHCAALPEALLESELFGYERGAFTGAASRKPGRFELANGGTLLLDEIGEISLATQVKLLRVLQDGSFERLGGTQALVANVRILAATHRDLNAMRAEGQFRDDLYYRLGVFPVEVPPLRERPEDIPELASALLARAERHAGRHLRLADDAVQALVAYEWPGNVRELANIMERLAILATGSDICAAEVTGALPRSAEPRRDGQPDLAAARSATDREVIERALAQAGGNRTAAAKLLGIGRRTLYAKLAELSIR